MFLSVVTEWYRKSRLSRRRARCATPGMRQLDTQLLSPRFSQEYKQALLCNISHCQAVLKTRIATRKDMDNDGQHSDSWVNVDTGSIRQLSDLQHSTVSFERLLSDAQHESKTPSLRTTNASQTVSHRSSPPLSVVSGSTGEMFTRPKIDIPQQQINDFIWDWSSRPEVTPPCDYDMKYKKVKHHPVHSDDSSRSDDDSKFDIASIPRVIFSHACSFLVGATLMFICFKKYSSIARLLRIVWWLSSSFVQPR